MGIARQITRNFFWLFFSELASGVLSLIIVIYLARVLGVKAFGLLNFVQAIFIYLLLIVDAGFSTYGTRETAKDKIKIEHLSINIALLRITWGIVVYLLSIIIVLLLPMPFELKVLFVVTFLLIISKNISPEWIFQGIEKFECVGLEKIINRLLLMLFIVLFVKSANDLIKVPFLEFVISITVALILILALFLRFIPFKVNEINVHKWKQYFIEAAPLGISYILLQVYFTIDTVMLGIMRNVESVGLYNAAYKIIFALLLFSTVLGKSIFPVLSRLYNNNMEKMKRLVSAIYNFNLFLGIPIAIGGMILSESIVLLVFGHKYYSAAWVFRILIWTILTVYTSVPFTFSLLAAGRQKEYLHSMAAGAFINILLNLYLIPNYGFIGAAVSTIFTEIIVWGIIFYYFSKNLFFIPLHQNILKYLFSAIIMALFLYFVEINLFISLISGIFIYLSLNMLLKSISINGILELFKLTVSELK